MRIQNYADLPNCFITGTDTDAGKTFVACQILTAWQSQGYSVGAFKPVASGAIWQDGELVSEDAMALAAVTGQSLAEINPFTFEHPASPHIADSHGEFDLAQCLRLFGSLQNKYDRVLVEGAGGWCVPLSHDLMMKDLANALALPVVLVSRIGLGCINHSLLSIAQIKRDTDLYHGWIANILDPNFTDIETNIQAIQERA